MATIFSKIASGEIPSFRVGEDERFFAFLDINPVQKGHTLVIPKQEVDNIFDLDDYMLGDMMIFAKKVARKIEENFDCRKVAVVVIGLEVPHAHIHLIPINKEKDLDFSKKMSLEDRELEAIASRLQF